MYNENDVDKNEFVEVKEGTTVLVVSEDSNESMILLANKKETCGIKCYVLLTSNIETIVATCKDSHLPEKIVYAPLNDKGEAYFCSSGQTSGVAICAKEFVEHGEIHLKLCKVRMVDKHEQMELSL